MTDFASDQPVIQLDTPLARGEQMITEITLRKPKAGELRGTSLADLASLKFDALQVIFPRITTPALTEADVANLALADFVQLGGAFTNFLLPKSMQTHTASLSE